MTGTAVAELDDARSHHDFCLQATGFDNVLERLCDALGDRQFLDFLT
jgi:hypothetical protein